MSRRQMVEHAGEVEDELGDGLEFMTADELARRLCMTPAWVYKETRAGRIPHVPLKRYVRYRRSRIAEWVREKEECA